MKLQILPILLASIVTTATFAEYRIRIKIHEPIEFKSSSEIKEPKPVEPAFDFSEFDGVGTIDAVDSAGYIDTTKIQSQWIQRALFKQYNDHLIYLSGNHQGLIDKATVINVVINGDILPCTIYDKSYVPAFNQTIFGCSTSGYNGLKYSSGQKFTISFK
ncbi:hypothetical protein N0614_09435 [Pseudomonas aeruginosa]|nr:hypothetical protein [Pseudomonas aeruginosa]